MGTAGTVLLEARVHFRGLDKFKHLIRVQWMEEIRLGTMGLSRYTNTCPPVDIDLGTHVDDGGPFRGLR